MNTAAEQPRLITIRAACALFSVKYDLVHDAILAGDLPAIQPGKSWLMKPSDVEELLYRRHAERHADGPQAAASHSPPGSAA